MDLTRINSDLLFATETRVLELAKEDDNGTLNPIHQYSPALRGTPLINMKDHSRIESNTPGIRPHLLAVARQYKDNSVFSPLYYMHQNPSEGDLPLAHCLPISNNRNPKIAKKSKAALECSGFNSHCSSISPKDTPFHLPRAVSWERRSQPASLFPATPESRGRSTNWPRCLVCATVFPSSYRVSIADTLLEEEGPSCTDQQWGLDFRHIA